MKSDYFGQQWNQIFGYKIYPQETSLNDIVFDGTQPVLLNGKHGRVKLFVQPNTNLYSYYSQEHETYSYVWGIPAHPKVAMPDIPEWCIKVVSERRYDSFRELLGTFVVIIDEPKQNRITFVTDILGIRPMFIGTKKGRIVFGSNVWAMYNMGMSDGKIDYDAVSAWIAYGFNCTDGSLFSDFRRLPPGAVVVFQDGKCTQTVYAEFEAGSQSPDVEQVSEEIHHIVSTTVKTLLDNHNQLSIALSGGYDSRYLLALSLSLGRRSINCATVCVDEREDQIASQIAEIVGVPLKKYPVNGSIWDIYDNVYHFMADGFPISKFVPYRIAQDYSGIPMLNGFMGDALIRGDSDRFMGKYETEWEDNPVDVLQRKHTRIDFRFLRKDIADRIKTRSRPWMERAVKEGSRIGKILGWQDFYYTHRFYISNNFLQHIELAEALLPFYSWELLSYKMNHSYKVFTLDTYRRIFQRHFPKMNIPRSSDLNLKKKSHPKVICAKQWAQQLLPALFNNRLNLLSKKLSIPVDIAYLAGLKRAEYAIFVFERLYLLEKRVRDAGLNFDWEYI